MTRRAPKFRAERVASTRAARRLASRWKSPNYQNVQRTRGVQVRRGRDNRGVARMWVTVTRTNVFNDLVGIEWRCRARAGTCATFGKTGSPVDPFQRMARGDRCSRLAKVAFYCFKSLLPASLATALSSFSLGNETGNAFEDYWYNVS